MGLLRQIRNAWRAGLNAFGGFVQNQHSRACSQGAGNRQLLLLPAGQIAPATPRAFRVKVQHMNQDAPFLGAAPALSTASKAHLAREFKYEVPAQ